MCLCLAVWPVLLGWCLNIGLRKKCQHAQCDTCWAFSQYIHAGRATPAEKRLKAAEWQLHIKAQYADRVLYWHMRWASRAPDSSILCIICDGLDRSKGTYPQWSFRAPKELEKQHRPRLVIHASMSHGYSCDFYISEEECTIHGASYILEILTRTIGRVKQIRAERGLPMVRHLCIQSDNTVAACKNAETALFMGILTRRFAFDSTNICYLRKGHTHEDVDFIFSLLLARVLRKIRVHTPLDLVQGIHAGMESLLLSKGYQRHVDHVSHVRDFGHWVAPLGIKPYNCFQNRQKIETPHSFTWKFRMDLSRAELQALAAAALPGGMMAGLPNFRPHDLDVFCITKQFMADTASHAPVLMLPNSRYESAVITPCPTQAVQVTLADQRKKQLRNLANLLEQLSGQWSADHSFFRAATELRVLANGRPQVPSSDGFLEGVAAAAAHHRQPLTLYVWHSEISYIQITQLHVSSLVCM